MTGSVTDSDKPLRYACDRCHSQKLRCPRSVDPDGSNPDEPCSRCRKAGVACVVSLRGKVGRPSKVAKRKPSRAARTYLTPETEFASCDPAMTLDSAMNQSWGQETEDRLVDMLDLDQQSHTATSPPKRLNDTSLESSSGSFTDSLPTSGMTPFDPFLMDFDAELDLPTFFIPTDIPTVIDSASNLDNPTASMSDILQDRNISNVVSPSMTQLAERDGASGSLSRDQLSTNESNIDNLIGKQTEDLLPSSTPTPEFSSTTCYQNLSDLNARILSCTARTDPGSNSSQLLKEVVGFSGELIDTARQSMPYFIGTAPASSRASTTSRNDSYASSDDGESSIDSACSLGQSGRKKSWASFGTLAREQSVPESAVIFLLLGCYTQILHLFEITTNCLWAQHCEESLPSASSEDTGTVGSLLEASLAIHTVTYLLSRLHKAFASKDAGSQSSMADDLADPQAWKRSFLGGKGLDDGLLGRAFGEIREREQWLMRRTQFLQQRINKCHI